jgi:hypothetical protein
MTASTPRSPVVFEDIHFAHRDYEPWLAYGQSKDRKRLVRGRHHTALGGRRDRRQRAAPGRHPHQPAAAADRLWDVSRLTLSA